MANEAQAPVVAPMRAAQPVAKAAPIPTALVAGPFPMPDRRERARAAANARWHKPDAAVHAADATDAPRMQVISQAVTSIAAALEPLSRDERQRALDAVVVMMG